MPESVWLDVLLLISFYRTYGDFLRESKATSVIRDVLVGNGVVTGMDTMSSNAFFTAFP